MSKLHESAGLKHQVVPNKDHLVVGDGPPGKLVIAHGPLISGDELCKALGYRSGDALRQARKRDSVPVAVFRIAGRKGLFARTNEVESWLASLPTTGAASRPVGKSMSHDHQGDDVPTD